MSRGSEPVGAGRGRGILFWAAVCGALLTPCGPTDSAADGFHNAALATRSLEQWLADVEAAIPELGDQLKSSQPGSSQLETARDLDSLTDLDREPPPERPVRGGTIQAELTPEQSALLARKGNDCLEILAYMRPENIIPREFPDFQLAKIPEYRDMAKRLLTVMGPTGTALVTNRLRADLMSPPDRRDMVVHGDYYRDLLELLTEGSKSGNVSAEQLEALFLAGQGRKDPERAALAQEVQTALLEALVEGIESGDFSTEQLVALLVPARGSPTRGQTARARAVEAALAKALAEGIESGNISDEQLMALFRAVLSRKDLGQSALGQALQASLPSIAIQLPHLIEFLDLAEDRRFKSRIRSAAVKAIPEADVVELLNAQSQTTDSALKQSVRLQLDRINPSYKEIRDSLPDLFELAASDDDYVATTAREQLENAFVRAPMDRCLYYLGEVEPGLKKLIWEKIDVKVDRADASRRAGYVQTATGVLTRDDSTTPSRTAALRLVSRMKDPKATKALIDELTRLPRDLWAPSGETLRDLTGQDFGPKPGDKIADVFSAQKKWQAWWKEHGEE